jgi:hypothetical protein
MAEKLDWKGLKFFVTVLIIRAFTCNSRSSINYITGFNANKIVHWS